MTSNRSRQLHPAAAHLNVQIKPFTDLHSSRAPKVRWWSVLALTSATLGAEPILNKGIGKKIKWKQLEIGNTQSPWHGRNPEHPMSGDTVHLELAIRVGNLGNT